MPLQISEPGHLGADSSNEPAKHASKEDGYNRMKICGADARPPTVAWTDSIIQVQAESALFDSGAGHLLVVYFFPPSFVHVFLLLCVQLQLDDLPVNTFHFRIHTRTQAGRGFSTTLAPECPGPPNQPTNPTKPRVKTKHTSGAYKKDL
jgi:hypothetical protein